MNEKQTQNRGKLFIQNMVVFGFSTVLTKLVPLIMLPIITAYLVDTADYGRYDMFLTIVEFGTNIAVLGLYDAMFREFFEKDELSYKKTVTSTALNIVLISGVATFCILTALNKLFSKLFLGDYASGKIVIIAGFVVLLSSAERILAAPLKMENKRKIIVLLGVGGAIFHYAIAMAFVLMGMNYSGMIYANVLYIAVMVVVYVVLNHRHFELGRVNGDVAKTLLKIGIPLMPTFIIYWVFHAMDKIMITNMMGLGDVGIYSVGSKVAQISQIIYTAFSMGWQYFAFSTMKDKDQIELNSKVMKYLSLASYVGFIIVTFADDFIFETFFRGDYVQGIVVFPYLFLSPLILMLYQVIGNQTIVYKKSYLNTISLLAGAATNLVLNYVLIQSIGIKGAAIATLFSYIVSFVCMILIALRHKWLVLEKDFVLTAITTFLFLMSVIFTGRTYQTIFGLIAVIIILVINKKEILSLLQLIKTRRKV